MILTDGLQPEGVTMIFQDSVFMMPHLGVLSTIYPDAAWNIFDKDCLLRLGSIIAPKGMVKSGELVMEIELEMEDGSIMNEVVKGGEIKKIELGNRKTALATILPSKNFDIGNGYGKELVTKVEGGIVGIIFDGRGRPITFEDNEEIQKEQLLDWLKTLEMYPENLLEEV